MKNVHYLKNEEGSSNQCKEYFLLRIFKLGFLHHHSLIHLETVPGTYWTLLCARHWPKCINQILHLPQLPQLQTPSLLPATATQWNKAFARINGKHGYCFESQMKEVIHELWILATLELYLSMPIPLFTLYFSSLLPVSSPTQSPKSSVRIMLRSVSFFTNKMLSKNLLKSNERRMHMCMHNMRGRKEGWMNSLFLQ